MVVFEQNTLEEALRAAWLVDRRAESLSVSESDLEAQVCVDSRANLTWFGDEENDWSVEVELTDWPGLYQIAVMALDE